MTGGNTHPQPVAEYSTLGCGHVNGPPQAGLLVDEAGEETGEETDDVIFGLLISVSTY